MPGTVWTIGHSNRPIEAFLELLGEHRIELLADVRRFPGSRVHPQFRREALEAHLRETGIAYRHLAELGGRRGVRAPESPNTAWRVEAFNAYADYMATAAFAQALEELAAAAEQQRAAMMCAEAVPWRCHRRLIADALVVRGWEVIDILGPRQAKPHQLTPFASVRDGRLSYPGESLFDEGRL